MSIKNRREKSSGKRGGIAFSRAFVLLMVLGFAGAAHAEWSADAMGEGSGLDRGAMIMERSSPVPGGGGVAPIQIASVPGQAIVAENLVQTASANASRQVESYDYRASVAEAANLAQAFESPVEAEPREMTSEELLAISNAMGMTMVMNYQVSYGPDPAFPPPVVPDGSDK